MPYNNFYGFNQNYGNTELKRLNQEKNLIEDRIQQIQQSQSQPMQQPPIQNIINSGTTKVDLEAKILSDGQTANDVIIQNRTVFIDEKNKKVSIKETDGTISKEYEIIVPLTPEQKQIEELKATNNLLQAKLNNVEVLLNEYAKSNGNSQSTQNVIESNAISVGNVKSATKKSSKSNDE